MSAYDNTITRPWFWLALLWLLVLLIAVFGCGDSPPSTGRLEVDLEVDAGPVHATAVHKDPTRCEAAGAIQYVAETDTFYRCSETNRWIETEAGGEPKEVEPELQDQ